MAFDATKWITSISKTIKDYNPEIDTSLGTMVGDTVVLPLSIIREILDKTKDFVGSTYSFDGIINLLKDPERINDIAVALGISSDEVIMSLRTIIENVAKDYGITRQPATYATGVVYYIPKGDLSRSENWQTYSISSTNKVKSIYGLFYIPTATFVFEVTQNNYATYFVPELGTYAFQVTVKCEQPGVVGNIGPNQIDYDFGYYLESKLDRAINLSPIIGGYDEETDEQLIERIKSKWKGINLGTISGYKQLLAQYGVRDVYIAGPGDPFMERAVLGAVDVYIRDYQVLTVRISLDLGTLGLKGKKVPVREVPNLKEYMYVRDVVYNNQPLIEFRDNTALWKWSTRANDMIAFPNEDSITVDVAYNATVAEIQKILDKEENKILGLDVMVREAWPLDFSITCSLTYFPGYSPTIVQQNVRQTLLNYIKSLPMGSKVADSDVYNVIEDVPGVDTVVSLQLKVGNNVVDLIQASPIEFLNLKEVIIP
jgi:hypothetical protein